MKTEAVYVNVCLYLPKEKKPILEVLNSCNHEIDLCTTYNSKYLSDAARVTQVLHIKDEKSCLSEAEMPKI